MRNKAMLLQKRTDIDWGGLEKSLHENFGVNAVTFKKSGDRRTAGDISLANRLCYLIKNNPEGERKICDAIQKYLNHEARLKKRYVTEECDAGMYKIVVPVIQENEIEGFVSVCGRPFYNSDRIYTFYIHKTIGEEDDEIKDLLSTLNPITYHTIKEIINYITSYS